MASFLMEKMAAFDVCTINYLNKTFVQMMEAIGYNIVLTYVKRVREYAEKTIRNVDNTYKAELNFVDEFNLKGLGMILEIEQEFNTIKLCFQQTGMLDKKFSR